MKYLKFFGLEFENGSLVWPTQVHRFWVRNVDEGKSCIWFVKDKLNTGRGWLKIDTEDLILDVTAERVEFPAWKSEDKTGKETANPGFHVDITARFELVDADGLDGEIKFEQLELDKKVRRLTSNGRITWEQVPVDEQMLHEADQNKLNTRKANLEAAL